MNTNNRITQSIIVGLTTLLAAVAWSGLKNILFESNSWILPSISFFILLIFLSLNWILAKSKIILLTTFFFVLISFFLIFGFKLEYLIILSLAFLFFFLASQKVFEEKEARIKIEVFRILKRGLPLVLTGLSLIIATAYYFSPMALTGNNEITIPRPLFDKVIDPVLMNFSQTQGIEIALSQLGIQMDIRVDDMDQELKDNLYNSINSGINKQSKKYEGYLTLGLAIGFFFALKVISIPFMWLVILFAWIIFKILISCGAVKIQEESVLRQIIKV